MFRTQPHPNESLFLHNSQKETVVHQIPEERLLDPAAYHQEYHNAQSVHQEALQAVISGTREKLDALSEMLTNIEVTPENEREIEERVRAILHKYADNGEGVRDMFDLGVGDRFIWNAEVEQMNIVNPRGNIIFSIRFQEFTPQENQEKSEIPRNSLADWLTSHGAYPGKNNSCGASVGELLNRFGLRSVLPQSGRDGKNWDTILESSRVAPYFQKIPVWHPDEAPAGSVLVFNENAKLGSSARRRHGHVEIKNSRGNYVSYYESANAGGSSRTSEKNPDQYKRLTGFTGYAYVYNGTPLPDATQQRSGRRQS